MSERCAISPINAHLLCSKSVFSSGSYRCIDFCLARTKYAFKFFSGLHWCRPPGLTAGYLLDKESMQITILEQNPIYVGGISRTATY
jgi:hypothetical protein